MKQLDIFDLDYESCNYTETSKQALADIKPKIKTKFHKRKRFWWKDAKNETNERKWLNIKEKNEKSSAKKQKKITINDVIESKKKAGKTNNQIAQELVDKGKAQTLEEALKIVEGV